MANTLKVHNSFTRGLEPFQPVDAFGRYVKWYSCGPTVYDASHMGHARAYISIDINRRILTNYFGYDVLFIMNITDIDDKIIKRARNEYLLAEFTEKVTDLSQVIANLTVALATYEHSTLQVTDPDKKVMREKIQACVKSRLETANKIEATSSGSNLEQERMQLLMDGKDVFFEWLDSNRPGDQVFDNDVFGKFAKQWEGEFFVDMKALNILPPDVLTRVSEYVPEIVTFIEKIMENGYGYESNGSVYFDVVAFQKSPNHTYAKLVPEAVGDLKALEEGEGELTGNRDGEKRSSADFALWKTSKPGEPSWDSPWGKGRPGWHIECSAMASAIVGDKLDIHTGGVDLKFPHHDNELAQSEAYFNNDSWVKYFLHSGHLTISGCKMSKSLKNFITIREALEQFTASQLRLTFLLHSWKDTLDYSPSGMQEAVQVEKKIQEFFLTVSDCLRACDPYPKWTEKDLAFQENIQKTKNAVHTALCNNMNTRDAVFALRDLISVANVYVQTGKSQGTVNAPLLKQAAVYVTKMFRIFGVIQTRDEDTFGFSTEATISNEMSVADVVLPVVHVLSDFRENVRMVARQVKDAGVRNEMLRACDDIRDIKLPQLGVRIEDHEGCPTVIKYVGKEAINQQSVAKERQEKIKLCKPQSCRKSER